MTRGTRPNPFHVLGLPVDASDAEIVERGQEGTELAGTEEERKLYDWAMRELIGHPDTRRRHAVTEAPDTDYRDERWKDFARLNGRNPANTRALTEAGSGGAPLKPSDIDWAALLGQLAAGLGEAGAEAEARQIRAALEQPPVQHGNAVRTVEVSDVLFG